MNVTKKWFVKGKEIVITAKLDDFNPNKVITNKFHIVNLGGRQVEMAAKTNKDEFFTDLSTQIKYLESTNFSDQDFFDALIFASVEHIKKFNRIFQADLWSYLNCNMFILEATKGQFHNLYRTDEEAVLIRNTFEYNAKSGLSKYLQV